MYHFFLKAKDGVLISLFGVPYSQKKSILLIGLKFVIESPLAIYLCFFSNKPYQIIFEVYFIYFITIAVLCGTVFFKNTLIPLLTNDLIVHSFETEDQFKRFFRSFIFFSFLSNILQYIFVPGFMLLLLSIQQKKLIEFVCLLLVTLIVLLLKYSVITRMLLRDIKIAKDVQQNTATEVIISLLLLLFLIIVTDKFPIEQMVLSIVQVPIGIYVGLCVLLIALLNWLLSHVLDNIKQTMYILL